MAYAAVQRRDEADWVSQVSQSAAHLDLEHVGAAGRERLPRRQRVPQLDRARACVRAPQREQHTRACEVFTSSQAILIARLNRSCCVVVGLWAVHNDPIPIIVIVVVVVVFVLLECVQHPSGTWAWTLRKVPITKISAYLRNKDTYFGNNDTLSRNGWVNADFVEYGHACSTQ